MTFTYQIDESDFVSAGKLLLSSRKPAWWRRVFVAVSILLLAASGSTFFYLRQFALAALCCALILLYAARPLLIAWQYRRQFRKIPALHDSRTLTADENGVHIVSALTDGRFAWQILDRFAENERTFILVQQGGRVFFPISKRQMALADAEAFRALCATHIVRK